MLLIYASFWVMPTSFLRWKKIKRTIAFWHCPCTVGWQCSYLPVHCVVCYRPALCRRLWMIVIECSLWKPWLSNSVPWFVAWPSLTDGGWLFSPVYKHVSDYCRNIFSNFLWARSQNCKKLLLPSSCLSVRPSVRVDTTRLPLDGFSWILKRVCFITLKTPN